MKPPNINPHEIASLYEDVIQTPGWGRYLEECVLPLLQQLRKDLITKEHLVLDERVHKQKLLKAIVKLISDPYIKASHSIPSELTDMVKE